ncbi:MAG: hypothetical protein ACI9Z3_001810, partial [Roseivirga sp.]
MLKINEEKKMRRINSLLLYAVLLLASVQIASAQVIGNEWINYSQPYFKIKTGSNDIHRVTYSSLVDAGFDLTGTGSGQLKMYHRGQEVAIFVQDGNDGRLDDGDYLEFYGKKNDGTQDTELFNFPSDQIHKFYNLFSDTTAFFLTSSASSGAKRMEVLNESTSGLGPVAFHNNEILNVYTSEFSFGQYYPIGNPNGEV